MPAYSMRYSILLRDSLQRDFAKIPPQAQRLLLARSGPWQAPGDAGPENDCSSFAGDFQLEQLKFNCDVPRPGTSDI